jgi:hypothetical protein
VFCFVKRRLRKLIAFRRPFSGNYCISRFLNKAGPHPAASYHLLFPLFCFLQRGNYRMETPNAEGIGAGFPYCVFLYLNQPCRAENKISDIRKRKYKPLKQIDLQRKQPIWIYEKTCGY